MKKLKKTEAALEALKKELSEEVGSEKLDKEKREALQKELESVGCPI
jgi:hypothetical protein